VSAIKRTSRLSPVSKTAVSTVVESYLHRIRAEDKVRAYKALPRWKEAVGADLAEVTLPERINKNILYVRVIDAVWAQELSFKKAEILKRLYAAKAVPPLDDIVFIPGDPTDFGEE